MPDIDYTPNSALAVQVHVPHFYFYVITAQRGGGTVIDTVHETNYLICNGYQEALDLMNRLPKIEGGYVLHSVEVDSDMTYLAFVASLD